ncbi:MAG: MBL fold metallo-hydrolase [Deltaproteobacteria bacterium]|nr:MBL fold metallo-hydrolase [Deltaproteobacteria bacterium]
MNPLFHPQLVNGPLGDPVLYIDMKFAQRAILFDLGEIRSLTPRKILKTSHVFISHTHMDHFIGFDHLLRICLGRPKVVNLYGPPNFLDQVKNKISAYTWNLVENYSDSLELMVVEVHPDRIKTAHLRSSTGFKIESKIESKSFNGILHEEMSFLVRAVFLDHKIPCLAFALEEKFHLNIMKTELDKMGLIKGPWLRELKEAVWRGDNERFPIRAFGYRDGKLKEQLFPLGTLQDRILKITPGQKIGYVVDTIYNEHTQEAIKNLVTGADHLFIETAFLEEDGQRAKEKYHLTARQAGTIAGRAGVKQMIPFHVSPKYSLEPNRVFQEAHSAFRQT